jgi:hypothetical protein
VHYTRVYAGPDGLSHFDEITVELAEVDFAPPAPPFLVSAPVDSTAVLFCSAPAGWHGGWHPAPHRQFFVMMDGELEVEAADGDSRRFGVGSVVLLEDVSGQGHVTRVVGNVDVRGVFIQLPQ